MKSIAISSYLMLLYWVSLQFPDLHMVFFPTLGAFGFICITRTVDLRWIVKICCGAVLSSVIGVGFHYLHSGAVSLLATTLITFWMIHYFKWNAPPILAIALIPFFAQSGSVFVIPLSVSIALIGLLSVTSILYLFENKALALKLQSQAKGAERRHEAS